jgi:Zn-dependent alcohol dehydrogenase
VIETVTLAAPGEGEIEVRVEACAICLSDISAAEGKWGGQLPAVYGHEAAGVVSECGPGVEAFTPGDRVLVTLIRSCGICPACERDAPTSCDRAWDAVPSPIRDGAGASVTRGMNTGGFAERVVVTEAQCALLPSDLPMDVASLLACGVITGFGAGQSSGRPTSNSAPACRTC